MTRTYDCSHPYTPTPERGGACAGDRGQGCDHPPECHPPASTGLDLDKLEGLHQSTTPGPWKVRQPPDGARACLGMIGFIEAPRLRPEDAHAIEILGEDTTLYPNRDDDMAWIVAAHEAFSAMLERIRELAQELEDARYDAMGEDL